MNFREIEPPCGWIEWRHRQALLARIKGGAIVLATLVVLCLAGYGEMGV